MDINGFMNKLTAVSQDLPMDTPVVVMWYASGEYCEYEYAHPYPEVVTAANDITDNEGKLLVEKGKQYIEI